MGGQRDQWVYDDVQTISCEPKRWHSAVTPQNLFPHFCLNFPRWKFGGPSYRAACIIVFRKNRSDFYIEYMGNMYTESNSNQTAPVIPWYSELRVSSHTLTKVPGKLAPEAELHCRPQHVYVICLPKSKSVTSKKDCTTASSENCVLENRGKWTISDKGDQYSPQ